MKRYAKKITKLLLYILPIVLFFSYHPVISIAESSTMNIELSLPEIWLVVFFICALPFSLEVYKYFGWKKILLAIILPVYFSLGIVWSGNRLRTLLTAGIIWLIVYTALHFIFLVQKEKKTNFRRNIIRVLLISATIASIFCWIQCILDLSGIAREYTLLCRGCVAGSFGFPHPNGFAIEPQFMGNLLIAPVLVCLYLLINRSSRPRHKLLLVLLTILLTTTLFITFSRGAIYALIAATIALLILTKKQKNTVPFAILKTAGLVICSFLISLTAQGLFAATGPTSDTFVSGVTKSIHQLTLGKIDLRPNAQPDSIQSDAPVTDATQESVSQFSGYVAESTDTRLNLNGLAIGTLVSSPRYVILGTGLGSAGIAIHNYAPSEIGPKEIVQNEYISLLLETGIIGVALIILIVSLSIWLVHRQKQLLFNPLLCGIIFGFLLTLCFFSGLPNALHVYLFPLFFVSFFKNDSIVKDII